MRIGSSEVGSDRPCFIIAEVGVNHNGDADTAHRLIDVAADTGADAVKFQTFNPAALASAAAAAAPYQRSSTKLPHQRALLEGLALPRVAWQELYDHAEERHLPFLSTPFDLASAELLANIGVPALKIASGELNNLPLIRGLAELGLPLLVSTGMGDFEEVAAAIEAGSSAPGLAVFHCVSSYPAPLADVNLRVIPVLQERFGVPVGWSDHSLGSLSAVVAVTLGADLVEKHLTLDRDMSGPDHRASADPEGFSAYVQTIRDSEIALGDGRKRLMPSEQENRHVVRRSLHAARDLPRGRALTPADVVALRPAVALPPDTDVTGAVVRRDVPAGAPLRGTDLRGWDEHGPRRR